MMLSSHLYLCLPLGLVFKGFHLNIFSHQVPPRVADRGMPPDMEGTGEIKYPGQTKTSTAALRLTEGSVKARGRKP